LPNTLKNGVMRIPILKLIKLGSVLEQELAQPAG